MCIHRKSTYIGTMYYIWGLYICRHIFPISVRINLLYRDYVYVKWGGGAETVYIHLCMYFIYVCVRLHIYIGVQYYL